MSLAGWRFLPAVLAPAILFGVAHTAQGDSIAESAGIVVITGFGGLFFGWFFVRWRFSLWSAIFVHMGMNTLWEIFAFGENAIGGWFGNGLRVTIVLLVLVCTVWLAPKSETPGPAGRI